MNDAANDERFAGGVPLRDVESVYAAELAIARAEVFEWAEELYLDQMKAWVANMDSYQARLKAWRAAGEKGRGPTKPKPHATWEQCLAKSRQIRIKRERDATRSNDLTNPYA